MRIRAPLTQTVLTTCTTDCPDGCSILATLDGGRPTGLRGNPDHPVTRGFLCRKAADFLPAARSPRRVTVPMVREGSSWRELTWEEAIDLAAAKIDRAVRDHGGLSVFHYQNAGSLGALKRLNLRFFNVLGGATTAGGSLCGGAGAAGQIADFGAYLGHDPLDLMQSELIVLWGRNPVATGEHLLPIIKESGARVWLVDPLASPSARHVHRHLRPLPNSDGQLALAVAKSIVETGLADESWLAGRASGWEGFRAGLAQLDLDGLVRACGLARKEVEELAGEYGRAKPAAIVPGWGVQRYVNGAQVMRLVDALGAITGNLGVSGGGVSRGREEHGAFDRSVTLPGRRGPARKISKPLLGAGLQAVGDPPVRVAVIDNGNPAGQSPNARKVAEALSGIDFKITIDRFMTDTAASSDLFLPATHFLEEEDVVGSYWHTYLGAVVPVEPCHGEAKTDLEIFQLLAGKLGFGAEMEGSPREWLAKIMAPLAPHGVTYESLAASPAVDPFSHAVPFKDRFVTASGRFEFTTAEAVTRDAPDGYPLRLISRHRRTWMHSQIPPGAMAPTVAEAKVHPRALKEAGLAPGNRARLVSPAGTLEVKLVAEDGHRPEVVEVTQGGWLTLGNGVNVLTDDVMSAEGQNAAYYETFVRLEPLR